MTVSRKSEVAPGECFDRGGIGSSEPTGDMAPWARLPNKSWLVQEWAGKVEFTCKTATRTLTVCALDMGAKDVKFDGGKVPNWVTLAGVKTLKR